MSRISGWVRENYIKSIILLSTLTVLLLAGAFGVARATDSPAFCMAACHEMNPYHTAWAAGAHKDVECVECHVDPGAVARLAHKAEATKELWVHLTEEPTFPLADPAGVPNERCIGCHEKVAITSTGFDHAKHAAEGECQSCHSDTGHSVTPAALKAAGIYNPSVSKRRLAGTVAHVDAGAANIAGHVAEPCSRCHDMAKTGCASCHEPKHETAGPAAKTAECSTCHTAGEKFAFTHPAQAAAASCGSCHSVPAKHTYRGTCSTCHSETGVKWAFAHNPKADCTNCHTVPAKHSGGTCSTCHSTGSSWAFTHPTSGTCTECHTRPANHKSGSCTTCHATGVSWAFRHPNSSSCTTCHNRPAGHSTKSCSTCHRSRSSWAFSHPSSGGCTSCHNRPSSHSTKSCTTCHKAGASWAFKHPGSGSSCTSCHSRPGGHKSGTCSKCHSTSSWKFRHPSGSCSSCHKAPGNHYGSSCSSCHSPGRAWSSASFNHPRVPGGEHTYRSFSCSSCHPSGYSSVNCTRCHDSNEGGDDDDD